MTLGALGLSARAEEVYRALVRREASNPDELARLLGLPAREIIDALADVVEQGLAAPMGHRYVAAPPPVALGALLRQRRDELRQAENELVLLAEEHRNASSERSVGDLVEVVTGRDAVAHRFAQVQRAARQGVRAFVLPNPMVVAHTENPDEEQAINRGVRYRVVAARAVLDTPGMLTDVAMSIGAGEEIRIAASLPLRMVIADDELGMVPLTEAGAAPGAVLVHRSALLQALIALFEAVWSGAYRLRVLPGDRIEEVPPTAGLDVLDTRILTLMLAGLTDQSVALQLGLSLRTVQRRIRYLMDLARVGTRIQLGWHAARHGWA